jgi:hypothetical protein
MTKEIRVPIPGDKFTTYHEGTFERLTIYTVTGVDYIGNRLNIRWDDAGRTSSSLDKSERAWNMFVVED